MVSTNKPKASTSKDDQSEEELENEDDEIESKEIIDEARISPQDGDVEMQENDVPSTGMTDSHKEQRPKKKRRKVAPEDEVADQEEVALVEPQVPSVANEISDIPASEPLDTYIPSFPLPSQPAVVSKAQRTLQGMDSAMLDAEIVDPKLTASLASDTQGINEHLSPRMLKRLDELGVTELFAGG